MSSEGVLILEDQGDGKPVSTETDPANFDAILNAVGNGIIVVKPLVTQK